MPLINQSIFFATDIIYLFYHQNYNYYQGKKTDFYFVFKRNIMLESPPPLSSLSIVRLFKEKKKITTHFLVCLLQYSYKQKKRISRQFVRVGFQPLTLFLSAHACSHVPASLMHALCQSTVIKQLLLPPHYQKLPPTHLHYLCFTHSVQDSSLLALAS